MFFKTKSPAGAEHMKATFLGGMFAVLRRHRPAPDRHMIDTRFTVDHRPAPSAPRFL